MNKVMLLGRLGQDPERKQIKGGKTLARFSLATDKNVRQEDGSWEKKAEWHQINAWEKQAEQVLKKARKGDAVAVVGRLQYNKWEDPDGRKRRTSTVVAETVSILGRPQSSEPANAEMPKESPTQAALPESASIPF
jgi:single-strand DNA-binding protein